MQSAEIKVCFTLCLLLGNIILTSAEQADLTESYDYAPESGNTDQKHEHVHTKDDISESTDSDLKAQKDLLISKGFKESDVCETVVNGKTILAVVITNENVRLVSNEDARNYLLNSWLNKNAGNNVSNSVPADNSRKEEPLRSCNHDWIDLICEPEHPHNCLQMCTICNATQALDFTVYGTSSSTHTPGLGHATPTSCSYPGCTYSGTAYQYVTNGSCQTCCGIEYGHTFILGPYYETAHPHYMYWECSICGFHDVTSTTYSGTYPGCAQCNMPCSHNYVASGSPSSTHDTANNGHAQLYECTLCHEQYYQYVSVYPCCDCGNHLYGAWSSASPIHVTGLGHEKTRTCNSCNEEDTQYVSLTDCDICFFSESTHSTALRNMQEGKYIKTTGSAYTVDLFDADLSYYSFIPDANGRFIIRSDYDGSYLSYNLTYAFRTPSSDGNFSKWIITETTSGYFKITPYLIPSKVLTYASGYFPLDTYTDNAEYSDEWDLFFKVNLFVTYDNAMVSRYGSNQNARSEVVSVLDALKNIYKEQLCLKITESIPQSAYFIDSLPDADSCGNRLNHNANCECTYLDGRQCDNNSSVFFHHKNIYNMFHFLSDPSPNVTFTLRMAFTGHETCNINEAGDHSTSSNGIGGHVIGLGNFSRGICISADHNPTWSKRVSTAAHEFGHLYGAPDHYDASYTGDPSKPGINDECIWGKRWDKPSVLTNGTICEYCKRHIRANLHKYYN